MTTLTFNSDATETLPGGEYSINEGPVSGPFHDVTVGLTFTGPTTIVDDTNGAGYQSENTQNINFGILTIDKLGDSGTATTNLNGRILTSNGDIVVSGYYGSNLNIDTDIFNNNGTLDPIPYGTVKIDTNVMNNNGTIDGIGSFTIDAKVLGGTGMDFMQYQTMTLKGGVVGAGQTFNVGYFSNLNIDEPGQFHGSVNVSPEASTGGSAFTVSLADLTATSYSFVNKSLSLYDGNHLVDNLRFADSSAFGVYQSGGSVIVSNTSHGIALPLHAMS